MEQRRISEALSNQLRADYLTRAILQQAPVCLGGHKHLGNGCGSQRVNNSAEYNEYYAKPHHTQQIRTFEFPF
ncbi:hypothetical protein D3C73_792720 [compost metagenome]